LILTAFLLIVFPVFALCNRWGGQITVLIVGAVGLTDTLNAKRTRYSRVYAMARRALLVIKATRGLGALTPARLDIASPEETMAIFTAATAARRTTRAIIGDAFVAIGTRRIVPLIIDTRPIRAMLTLCGALIEVLDAVAGTSRALTGSAIQTRIAVSAIAEQGCGVHARAVVMTDVPLGRALVIFATVATRGAMPAQA